jgi:hypothetical protein
MSERSQQVSDVADLRDFLRHAEILAIDPRSPTDLHKRRPFVPARALQHYLTEPAIKKLLSSCLLHTTYWRSIQQYYSKIFTILIIIGKGDRIDHFISYDNLDDDRLPFRSDSDWPPDCRDFFQEFSNAQWRFCAQPLRKDRLNNTRLYDETIIPITSIKELKRGPDSCIYKVDIYPGYNHLTERVRLLPSYNLTQACC